MFDILRKHAVDKVWCSPAQDNQIILAAERITRKGGDLVSTQVMTRRIPLPEQKKYFHVFYAGQLGPEILGLLPLRPSWAKQDWIKVSDAVNALPLFSDVYTDNGVKLPLNRVYYQFTTDRALVFCVELGLGLDHDLNMDQVYFRFYTNAYYDTVEANNLTVNTRVVFKRIFANADILELQAVQAQWKTFQGAVLCFINGNLVDSVTMLNTKIGDLVECVLDTSVKRVVDLRLSDLNVFTSIRDEKQKYLLHYPSTGGNEIDYVDDIDVYLVNKNGGDVEGRYLHKNLHTTLRMVTHRDYSLTVENVVAVGEGLSRWLESAGKTEGDLYVRLYIRNSGLFKTLPYENNRIFELYKLPDGDVLNAMIGAASTVPYWTAANLENSDFVKLFDVPYNRINIDLIESAFGYNAISKVLADSPIYKDEAASGPEVFTLPPGLWDRSTIYEYDSAGVLLGWVTHSTGSMHIAQNQACSFIEGIVGFGTHSPNVLFGVDDIQLPTAYGYKVYMAYGDGTIPTTPWIDITGSDYYTVVNNRLKWQTIDEGYILMVRSEEDFLAYELTMTPIAGTLYFELSEHVGGLHRALQVPGADLDIWLNGKRLTLGLDAVFDFPNLHVFNKDYLIQPAGSTPQKITVRLTGFQESVDGAIVPPEVADDYGFIEHGVLSNNDRYDIRDDRVMSVYVKGCLKKRSDVLFSEEHEGVSVVNALNGQPYQVKERAIPLRGQTLKKTSELRQLSAVIDKKISDYMTVRKPEPVRSAPSAIQQRHRLYSPFFSHLVNDLASGDFPRAKLQQKLTDSVVMEICKDYLRYLDHDPLNEKFGIDYRFVLIHPHQLDSTILLDVESYAFMKHVVRLYGKNLISLSGHLNINLKEG